MDGTMNSYRINRNSSGSTVEYDCQIKVADNGALLILEGDSLRAAYAPGSWTEVVELMIEPGGVMYERRVGRYTDEDSKEEEE